MQRTVALAFAVAIAAATLPGISPSAAQSGSSRIFIPNHEAQDQRGEHYDTVLANYTRRCTDLRMQFEQARTDFAPSQQLAAASALYDQGVAHCEGGARLQGIDELTAAIRQLGAIPHVTL